MTRRSFALLALMGAGVLLAWIGWRATRADDRPAEPQAAIVHLEHPVAAAPEAVSTAVKRAMSGGSLLARVRGQEAGLAAAVTESILLAVDGNVEAYRRQVQSAGLELSPRYTGDGAKAEWTSRMHSLHGAALDLAGLRVTAPERGSVQQGEIRHEWRPAEPRGPNDIPAADLRAGRVPVVRVGVPARMKSVDDTRFDGELYFELARRPSDGKWIVVASGIRAPVGAKPVTPLF